MPVQFKDYYETLGVPKTSSADEIRKAFRKLARQHHPDMVKAAEKKAAEEKFKVINEAYEVLGDPEKRKKYDQLGADWNQPGGGQQPPEWAQGSRRGGFGEAGADGGEFHFGGTGFSDFFEQFFGGAGRRRGGTGFQPGFDEELLRGEDVEADIMVTLEEALRGSTRKISLRRAKNSKVQSFNVRIPAGVREGQRIRLAGAGESGPRGAAAGDLFLRVKFEQHPEFRIDGGDLIHDMQLDPWQAVLGCEISAPTLEGTMKLKIPAGTQNHQRFRLRGRGLPKEGGARGDLYAVADVVLPKMLTAKQRELWEQLAKESA
jgi:curved DNA-binding protein